ncbi:hypothetical protein [Nitratifractor sp.]
MASFARKAGSDDGIEIRQIRRRIFLFSPPLFASPLQTQFSDPDGTSLLTQRPL